MCKKDSGFSRKKVSGGSAPAPSTGWQRPNQWLAIPTVGASEEVFYGLHAVWNTTVNPCALLCNGTGAGYTVDWGDGTITNHSFNTRAEKNYVYSALSAATEFRGYRQALVKVIPQAGAVITSFNLAQVGTGFNYNLDMGWLDLVINFSTLTSQPVFTSGIRSIDKSKSIIIKKTPSASNLLYVRGLEYFEVKEPITSSSCSNIFSAGSIVTGKIKFILSNSCTIIASLFYDVRITADLSGVVLPTVPCYINSSFNLYHGTNSFPSNINSLKSSSNSAAYLFWTAGLSFTTIPSIDLSLATDLSNWIGGTTQVREIKAFGAKVTHSIANQLLDAASLNSYFTGLGTANAGATLTITGNPGAGSCTTSIATTKGWTIIN